VFCTPSCRRTKLHPASVAISWHDLHVAHVHAIPDQRRCLALQAAWRCLDRSEVCGRYGLPAPACAVSCSQPLGEDRPGRLSQVLAVQTQMILNRSTRFQGHRHESRLHHSDSSPRVSAPDRQTYPSTGKGWSTSESSRGLLLCEGASVPTGWQVWRWRIGNARCRARCSSSAKHLQSATKQRLGYFGRAPPSS